MRVTLPCHLRIRTHASRTNYQTSAPIQRRLRAAYYRGGTSRALIIQPRELPSNRKTWPGIFRQLIGSGDPYGRQLDGMGAGISSLSKICLVEAHGRGQEERLSGYKKAWSIDQARANLGQEEPSSREDTQEAHIDYTFVGLGIENEEVDTAGNCGNMSSAIGPYAYNARILPPYMYTKGDGEITVKIRNTNTNKFIDSTFTVVGGEAAVTGDYAIDGVAKAGSKIKLDFRSPYGSKTGKVLPTGKKIDIIAGYRVTCVDGPNPAVFVRADDLGVDGTILPNDFNKLPDKLALLETIRKDAAVAMGLAKTQEEVPRTIPKIGIVSMSATHPVLSGATLKTSQTDLVVRFISDTQPHRAIPLTAALTTAVAARIPGTIVEQLLAPDPVMENAITIGHASGRLQVNATMDPKNKLIPLSATVYRTARRIFEGDVFWTHDPATAERSVDAVLERHSLGMAFVTESRDQDITLAPKHTSQNGVEEERGNATIPADGMNDTPEVTDGPQKTSLDKANQSTNPLAQDISMLQEVQELSGLVLQLSEQLESRLSEDSSSVPTSASKSGITKAPEQGFTNELTTLKQRLNTLTESLQQTFQPANTPPPNPSFNDPTHYFPTSTSAKGSEWHSWARRLAKRKEGIRERVKRREEQETQEWKERHAWKKERKSHWKLDRNGDLVVMKRKGKGGRTP